MTQSKSKTKKAGRVAPSSRGGAKTPGDRILSVARNRRAQFEYEVVDSVEAGMVLTGTEVKSLRDGKVQLVDAYATCENGVATLHHAHIAEYGNGTYANHDPVRSRRLLLHATEIERLARKTAEKGFTLIPLEIYFKGPRAKVKLGLCRGKDVRDKRDTIRARDERRAAQREARGDG